MDLVLSIAWFLLIPIGCIGVYKLTKFNFKEDCCSDSGSCMNCIGLDVRPLSDEEIDSRRMRAYKQVDFK